VAQVRQDAFAHLASSIRALFPGAVSGARPAQTPPVAVPVNKVPVAPPDEHLTTLPTALMADLYRYLVEYLYPALVGSQAGAGGHKIAGPIGAAARRNHRRAAPVIADLSLRLLEAMHDRGSRSWGPGDPRRYATTEAYARHRAKLLAEQAGRGS
jgi:hypothetical protein